MGVLLTAALILGIAAAFIEFRLFYSVPFLKKMVEKSTAVGIGMSLALSWIIGLLFGASGLVVMLAGMGSTMMTEPIHAFNRKAKAGADKHDPNKLTASDFKSTYGSVTKLIKYTFMVMTAPVWIPVKVNKMMHNR